MDEKNKFLEKLFRMYPLVFNEHNIPDWYGAYSEVLANSNINYNTLFKHFITNWNQMQTPPSPKWFKDNISVCIETPKCSMVVQELIKQRDNAVPMPPEFKKRMEELKKKITMGDKYAVCG